MKTTGLLGLVTLVSVVATVVTTLFVHFAADAARDRAPTDDGLRGRLDALAREQAELAARLDGLGRLLESEVTFGAPAQARETVLSEEAIVQRVLDALENPRPTDPEAAASADVDAEAIAHDLLHGDLDDAGRAALWEELRESGRLDAVLAELERRAEAAPFDPVLRTRLGTGYLNKMLTESGPEAGRWGAKGAAAFGVALELDETNFDARFALAQHQYWANMRGDSLQNLRTLVAQQSGRTAEPKHAGAYMWLGNLLMDRGEADEALRVWSEGLDLFPDHAALRARIEAFDP